MEVYKEFKFDAAHFLPLTDEGHKCHNMHGHTYTVTLYFKGCIDKEKGWVIDFSVIKKVFSPILDQLDHNCLNNIVGLENPTSENVAIWIWDKLIRLLPLLSKIVISETSSCGCIYEGN